MNGKTAKLIESRKLLKIAQKHLSNLCSTPSGVVSDNGMHQLAIASGN